MHDLPDIVNQNITQESFFFQKYSGRFVNIFEGMYEDVIGLS